MNKKFTSIKDYINSSVPKYKGVKTDYLRETTLIRKLKNITGYSDILAINNMSPFIASLKPGFNKLDAGGYFIFTNSNGNKGIILYNYSNGYYSIDTLLSEINLKDYSSRSSENLNAWLDKYIDNSQGNWTIEKITGIKTVDTIIKLTDVKNNKYIMLWYDYFMDRIVSKYQLLIN